MLRKTPLKRGNSVLKSNSLLKKGKRLKKVSEKQKEKNIQKAEVTRELHAWMLWLWGHMEDSPRRCCDCNAPVYTFSTACFHHILEKSPYPEYMFDLWNIYFVCLDCHNKIHAGILSDKYKQVLQQTKEKALNL